MSASVAGPGRRRVPSRRGRAFLAGALRQWRRFSLPLRPARADLVFSPEYSQATSAVPLDPLRSELLLAFLGYAGLLRPEQVHRPEPASSRALRRVHTDEYLESLGLPGTLTRVVGVEVEPRQQDRFLRLQRVMVGGTILATDTARRTGRPAVNLGGGLHHAHANRGQGFCIFNDVAVAIAGLRERGFTAPILVVDLDLHDGDGTRRLFAADSTVYTYSIANRLWADAEAVASTSLALGDGVGDAPYLAALADTLPPVVRAVRPALVYYVAGVDPAHDDEIGDWQVTAAGMLERDRFVVRLLRRLCPQAPVVILLAGGYGPRAWRYHARSVSWLLAGRPVEPPSLEAMTLIRYRHLARLLVASGELAEPAAADSFDLTPDDLVPAFAPTIHAARFLDAYSPHQMEVVLERSGLLGRLRGLGFERPVLDLDTQNPSGHTLRVFGRPDRAELLAELRVRRDRAAVAGLDLLRIEWLLLQNPRRAFSAERPELPGQRHPGLGMLRDAVALLVLVCERLRLDGLLFVPSHYHLAAQASGGALRFVDPADQGRFLAIRRATAGLPLAAATAAIAAGRLREAATGGPFPWVPAPMVLPVSDQLRERVNGEDYERLATEAAAGYRLTLAGEPPPGAAP